MELTNTEAPKDWRVLKGAKLVTGFSVRLLISLLPMFGLQATLVVTERRQRARRRDAATEKYKTKMKEWSILTPINKAVVVLLVGLACVALPLEHDIGDSLRATSGIVMKDDILERSDGGVEQFLLEATDEHKGQRNH